VFLDRDGVLIETFVREGVPHPPVNLDETRVLPGVPEALRKLSAAGFLLIVVTNQPDVARGVQTVEAVERINRHLADHLAIDAVFVCFHDNADQCACRKPLPGMLRAAATKHQIDLGESFMVGDRWSDVTAGKAAGCTSILLTYSYSQAERCQPDASAASLSEAADIILQTLNQRKSN